MLEALIRHRGLGAVKPRSRIAGRQSAGLDGGYCGRSIIKCAVRRAVCSNSIEAFAPIGRSTSSPIYTSLTDSTASGITGHRKVSLIRSKMTHCCTLVSRIAAAQDDRSGPPFRRSLFPSVIATSRRGPKP
jgi:hypothetical protein